MKNIRDFSDAQPSAPNAEKYDGMSRDELLKELSASVAAAKADGTFSAATLDEFVAFVSPSLDDGSRRRLEELVAAIKGQ